MKLVSRLNLNTFMNQPAMETLAGLSFMPGFNHVGVRLAAYARILGIDSKTDKTIRLQC